jgi:hypothetical protein
VVIVGVNATDFRSGKIDLIWPLGLKERLHRSLIRQI